MSNQEKTWMDIEILQDALMKKYPGNYAPAELELSLSPKHIYDILNEAKGREVMVKHPDKGSDRIEVFHKNSDGTLERVV